MTIRKAETSTKRASISSMATHISARASHALSPTSPGRAGEACTGQRPWHAACGMSIDDVTSRSDSTIKEANHEQRRSEPQGETTLVDNEVYNLITTISSKLEEAYRHRSTSRTARPTIRSMRTAAAGRAGGAAAMAAGAIRSARQAPSPRVGEAAGDPPYPAPRPRVDNSTPEVDAHPAPNARGVLHNHPVAGPLSACYDEPAAREMATVHGAPPVNQGQVLHHACRGGQLWASSSAMRSISHASSLPVVAGSSSLTPSTRITSKRLVFCAAQATGRTGE